MRAIFLKLRDLWQPEIFVETGTYAGETATWAARHFPRVVTIEASQELHTWVQPRLRRFANLASWQGDSRQLLPQALAEVPRGLLWLDAHWSGGDTHGQHDECPLLGELEAINRSPGVHCVVVDNASLFCSPPPRPHRSEQWPDLGTVHALLANGGTRYVVLYRDVFTAVPKELQGPFSAFMQDLATEELRQRLRGQHLRRWWWGVQRQLSRLKRFLSGRKRR